MQIETLPYCYLLSGIDREVNEQLQRDLIQRNIITSNKKLNCYEI